MKIKFILLCICLSVFPCAAQQIICSATDREAYDAKIEQLQKLKVNENFGATIVDIGKTFLGTAYVAKTLEIGNTESLVINLQGLDCTTFVENVLAFSQLLKNKKIDFDDFTKTLETIRYKDGKLNGYASRLHYFTEWIADNEKKGLIKDITSEVGGIEITKEINFMSTHRDLYPFLKDNENFQKIQASEGFLNNQSICILPQDRIATNEHLLKSGDIIALSTTIKGLDVTHTDLR